MQTKTRNRKRIIRCGNLEILRKGKRGTKTVCGHIMLSRKGTTGRKLDLDFSGAFDPAHSSDYAADVRDLVDHVKRFFLERRHVYELGWKNRGAKAFEQENCRTFRNTQ